MSEFTQNQSRRIRLLQELCHLILDTGNAKPFLDQHPAFIEEVVPDDFIHLFDTMVLESQDWKALKTLTNKLLNIFYKQINQYPSLEPTPDSFLGWMIQNNQVMADSLQSLRPLYKQFMKDSQPSIHRQELLAAIIRLKLFTQHFTLKENILFPAIEKHWPHYRCIQIMWSFHDDIRDSLSILEAELSTSDYQLPIINRKMGDLFFNLLAIRFREEKILYPAILSSIEEDELEEMKWEAAAMGFPYISPEEQFNQKLKSSEPKPSHMLDLGTGHLMIEQIKLIFNHLPVDITYVDENDQVQYFSEPPHRIFPRTAAIIGRSVSLCHPPESVHVVEKIVDSFRKGEKDHADFWIRMKGRLLLIRYFAVRDQYSNYRGVLEVSQDVTNIQELTGEKRLLDW